MISDISNIEIDGDSISENDEMLRIINKIMRHDIRNRLSIAYGYMGLIREREVCEEAHLMEKAYEAVGKAIDITRKMTELETLTLSGKHMERTEIADVIEEISRDAGIEVKVHGSCSVRADHAIYSVFENLISNARLHGRASSMDIVLEQAGEVCRITVSDNGAGIPDPLMGQIFDEGISYGERRGTGLGLYIVKKTIERYGGTIQADKNEPSGARFVIELPLWHEKEGN